MSNIYTCPSIKPKFFLRTVNKKVIVAIFYNLIPLFGQYIGTYIANLQLYNFQLQISCVML